MPVLETERMKLRPLSARDEDNLLKIFADPITMEFYHGIKNCIDAKVWIEKSSNLYKQQEIGFLACKLKASGEFVGICGLPSSISYQWSR